MTVLLSFKEVISSRLFLITSSVHYVGKEDGEKIGDAMMTGRHEEIDWSAEKGSCWNSKREVSFTTGGKT